MIPWKYTTDFNKENHLFYKTIDTNYVIEAFRCTCGNTNFIIKYPNKDTNYICSICENKLFYDANLAWKNIEYFLYLHKDLLLQYDYDITIDEDKIIAKYFTYIPNSIDFLQEKVLFSKKDIFTLSLSKNGSIKESYYVMYDKQVIIRLKKLLSEYLNKNYKYFNIPSKKNKKLTLNMASFFLKNKHLKSFEFFYWENVNQFKSNIDIYQALKIISNNRKEKTVRKAIYQNHLNQIMNENRFYSSFIQIFTNKIKDPNLLVKFLKLKLYHIDLDNNEFKYINTFIDFLQTFYTDRQILNLFSKLDYSHTKMNMFFDLVREFDYCNSLITFKFKKMKCDLVTLHDYFVKIADEKRYEAIYKKRLNNKRNKTKACVEIKDYEVRLPQNGKELIKWADILHNCMKSYFDRIEMDETIIYGFFKNNELKFAVEINDGKLIQSNGKYNSQLEDYEQKILKIWMKRFFGY